MSATTRLLTCKLNGHLSLNVSHSGVVNKTIGIHLDFGVGITDVLRVQCLCVLLHAAQPIVSFQALRGNYSIFAVQLLANLFWI